VHQRFYEAGSPAGLRELEEHLRGTAGDDVTDPGCSGDAAGAQARADRT